MERILPVGKKVRVSCNPIDPDSPPCFVGGMDKYKGSIVTIAIVIDRKKEWYEIKENRGVYTWSGRWLEPLRAKKKNAKK